VTSLALAGQLLLKPLDELSRDELLRVLAFRNQPCVRRNMYTSHVISEAEHFAWAERARVDDSIRFFAVLHQGRIIGATSFNAFSTRHRRAEWGAYLGREFQGRGLGSAMEIATLDHGFGQLDLEKITGELLSFNAHALEVHLRIGFVREGTLRRHICRDGEWFDVAVIGILREEWAARRQDIAIREAA
jgi:UDP-4-amino-4,6-dideoxy-N-acetyl-beta-L-altrosamine N-acetyltransferase